MKNTPNQQILACSLAELKYVIQLSSDIRKVIKKRRLFPTDDSAKKAIYLATQRAFQKWTILIRNWKAALNRFMIEFEERLTEYI